MSDTSTPFTPPHRLPSRTIVLRAAGGSHDDLGISRYLVGLPDAGRPRDGDCPYLPDPEEDDIIELSLLLAS